MVALAWVGILRGFGGDIVDHVQKHKPAFALIVHIHAVVFVLWLVLFTVQILLIRSKKIPVHKRLGFALVYLAGLMAVIGPATALTVQHHSMADPGADPSFLSVQFTDILAFVGLTGAAIVLRRSPSAHKRLILLGTLYITDAGFARWLADPWLHLLGMSYWHFWVALYFGPNVLVALAGLYDLATRRRLHPAYAAGVAWIFGVQMLALSLYFSSAWGACARRIIAAWP
ncbi:MAG TPA: hypothetical protein VGG34_05240 [Opitutaceae bacterium]|jgi:hypothetical protein